MLSNINKSLSSGVPAYDSDHGKGIRYHALHVWVHRVVV